MKNTEISVLSSRTNVSQILYEDIGHKSNSVLPPAGEEKLKFLFGVTRSN